MGKKARFLSPYTDPPPPPPTSLLLSLSFSLSCTVPSFSGIFFSPVSNRSRSDRRGYYRPSPKPKRTASLSHLRSFLSSSSILRRDFFPPSNAPCATYHRYLLSLLYHTYIYTRAPLFQIHFQSFINLNDSISPSIVHQLRIMSSLLVFFSFLFLSFFLSFSSYF